MADVMSQLEKSNDLVLKTSRLYQKRLQIAMDRFNEVAENANDGNLQEIFSKPWANGEIWNKYFEYNVDSIQRSVLFWDTLRKRGNAFIENVRKGSPPVLHFDYEIILDARDFENPANYALTKILPPKGVTVNPKRRPYIIIDPRAGHGPGIGGFKDDSQVGVALRDGSPVYFVIFFADPEPGQTLYDVCEAERKFVHKVREMHPDSPKPVIIGNCQGGWAAMMLVASNPEETGPIVINGAPMSYWGGAWSDGSGDNPMRYSGGLLGGSWLASFLSDLGDGVFDGAYLVQNFEFLNPANTFWKKYYNLFSRIDTEPPRFLDFERWWGGFYLMNREEIDWIVQNLFVGNTLWSGSSVNYAGEVLDLRSIQSPVILFASMGDNITPPQQAFNWVADVYGSTEEIKSRGQVIVGLLHEDVGHLGIFVSGKVARKEYTQIASVLKCIEALPPGLYGMEISDSTGKSGKTDHEVEFIEYRLEDVVERLNRFQREDEKPFEAVAYLSEFNQRAYELFLQPIVKSFSNEISARLGRFFHPLRFERWALSDLNPWLSWLGPTADAVKKQRKPSKAGSALHELENVASNFISASLDCFRDLRDATSEALFFLTFGQMFNFYLRDKQKFQNREFETMVDPKTLPFVKEALASVAEGGYDEAICRVGFLLSNKGEPVPLAQLQLKKEMMAEYRELLPEIEPYERRRIRGEQEIICRYLPEKAIETLPMLLADPNDRKRLLHLLEKLLSDSRFLPEKVTQDQLAMLDRIKTVLS
jgi:pimeloyl-ACP methyl ester carboxylesterase